MMLQKKIIAGLCVAAAVFYFSPGCYKDKTVLLEGAEVTKTMSFTTDIVPLFNKDCNTSGCHNTGGIKPDLSAANAYNALQGGGYMNVETPGQSLLYLWMTGKKGTPMPLAGPNTNYNALVLAWIKQGAKNN
jgi:hypothetical protein